MPNTSQFKVVCNGGTTYITQLKTAEVESCLLVIFTAHHHNWNIFYIYICWFITVT